jgi:hypothetical protein
MTRRKVRRETELAQSTLELPPAVDGSLALAVAGELEPDVGPPASVGVRERSAWCDRSSVSYVTERVRRCRASRGVAEALGYPASSLTDRYSHSMELVASAHPAPSRLIRTPAARSASRDSGLVQWLPWSLFQIAG